MVEAAEVRGTIIRITIDPRAMIAAEDVVEEEGIVVAMAEMGAMVEVEIGRRIIRMTSARFDARLIRGSELGGDV